jgi:hypothetical protein
MRSRAYSRRFWRHPIVCVAVLLLGFCGCANLGEVAQFAKASQDVGKAFPAMADEAKAACNRANSFINAQNDLPKLHCEFYDQVNPSLPKANTPSLAIVNAALFNYISSLGNLASDDLSKVSGGFSSLSADLKQADPQIATASLSQAAAAGGLAKAIANIWASGYRQEKLAQIVAGNNEAVQAVAVFLSDYAAAKFLQSFEEERRYESSYCDLMKSPTAEPLATDLLVRKCAADQSRIEAKKKAVMKYQDALKTIAKTHQKLDDERGHWDSARLAKELLPEIVDLGSAAVSINQAF